MNQIQCRLVFRALLFVDYTELAAERNVSVLRLERDDYLI